MDLRQMLVERLKGSSQKELQKIIDDGIQSKEEAILPGLGVLFEYYYQSLDESSKASLCQSLITLLPQ